MSKNNSSDQAIQKPRVKTYEAFNSEDEEEERMVNIGKMNRVPKQEWEELLWFQDDNIDVSKRIAGYMNSQYYKYSYSMNMWYWLKHFSSILSITSS